MKEHIAMGSPGERSKTAATAQKHEEEKAKWRPRTLQPDSRKIYPKHNREALKTRKRKCLAGTSYAQNAKETR